jgi:hypothetical protein
MLCTLKRISPKPFGAQLWTPKKRRITLRLESIKKNCVIGKIGICSHLESEANGGLSQRLHSVLQGPKGEKFSSGSWTSTNWMRGANVATLRVQGLKSHDYHIWLERIIPVMIQGYVDEETWRVLAELSYFFRQLCAKELDPEVAKKLHKQAPELLCKLEMLLPPGFFSPIQHMILHLAHEAVKGGTVQSRWQYMPKTVKDIRAKIGNKCKIEASIAQAVLNDEVAYFTTKYYDDNIPTRHNPLLHYNAANRKELPKLSMFIGLGGKSSGAKAKKIQKP